MKDEKTLHKMMTIAMRLVSVMAIVMAINSFIEMTAVVKSRKNICNCNADVEETALNAVSANSIGQTPLLLVSEDNLSDKTENANLPYYSPSNEIDKINIEFPAEYSHFDLSAKPYMDYRKITNKNSNQYKLLYSDDISVDERGFLVDNEGYIAVAMGSYFGDIGGRFEITLDSGVVLKVIKVEEKSDSHTCENNFMGHSGDVIEFVIDTQKLFMQSNKWRNGYIFSGNFNNWFEFTGNIVKVEKVG